MSRLFALYSNSLKQRPLLTNVISTALLFGIGDVMAQTLFPADLPATDTQVTSLSPALARESVLDYGRLGRSMFYGGIIFAPIGDKWYKILNKVKIPTSKLIALGIKPTPKTITVVNTVARVFIDQACFPPVSVPFYYVVMTLLEQKSMEDIKEKLRLNYWPTLLSNWTVWPTIQLFNFGFVKVEYRLIVVNIVSLGWNCYISFMNNKKTPENSTPVHFPPVME
ncbi:hypothetical protein BABINDRAFT_160015 [Babjeviella inositovora NRRL Y-12698]|uniref:Protein SYM1 n=1 Tax=Babjeviella inositovora NRRL Y-12698 TaxID=984486 RepID=A0A1E3QXL3_9ASCO|nr:uncharacterized protein BABINDRAFT_160015 [Babjeviella inositovora NRRL Y-12698]ODQ81777.1 hypothetical protein BABINDRAFT_160015 [Babjeviella inositovora NRRL Y-12698]